VVASPRVEAWRSSSADSAQAAGLRRLADYIDDDEKSMARRDRRFEYGEVTHELRGQVDARLPFMRVKNARSLSPAHKKSLDIAAAASGPVMILGGGLAQGRTAAYYEEWALDDFQELAAALVGECMEVGAICVSPYVPERMLPGFRLGDGRDVAPVHCDDWWTLHLDGLDPATWIEAQGRRVRQTWNRDYRIARERGFSFRPVEATIEALDPLIPMFHETMKHNGDAVDEGMARWYLSRRLELAGAHYICVTEERGEPVGAVLLRIDDSYCDAYAVGTSPEESQWRDLYQVSVFVASMEFATSYRFSAIGFGRSHGKPKMIRGCRPDPLFRVRYPRRS